MKRWLLPIAALIMLAIATPVFAGWELGLSITPIPKTEEQKQIEQFYGSQQGAADLIYGFHFGYAWWYIFYGSWDSLVMPPFMIKGMTTGWRTDDQDNSYFQEGWYRPGFLNLFDVGLRLIIGPVVGFAEVGVNQIYIWKQSELDPKPNTNFGANMRLGAGLKFGILGVNASVTKVFPSFQDMIAVFQKLASEQDRQEALGILKQGLVPTLTVTLYF